MAKRHDLQKMAAFNLGVAEAVTHKKKTRDLDFHVRPLAYQRLCQYHVSDNLIFIYSNTSIKYIMYIIFLFPVDFTEILHFPKTSSHSPQNPETERVRNGSGWSGTENLLELAPLACLLNQSQSFC